MATIRTQGDPILSAVAKPVSNFKSAELTAFVEHMFAAMREKDGVGLSAPQLGVSERIFVYGFEYSPRYPDAPAVPIAAIINPEITWQSDETSDYEEGCLSVPHRRGMITRSVSVTFKYQDLDGNWHSKTEQGFAARIVLHEIDHLNGILISDRAKILRNSQLA